MNKSKFLLIVIIIGSFNFCTTRTEKKEAKKHRFFADNSFWNQPIPANPEIDSLSSYYIGLLKKDPSKKNFGINSPTYSIPIYEAGEKTPKYKVKHQYCLGHVVCN